MTKDKHITETNWWHDLCDGILGPRKGGARIIVDAKDAKTGVGKTGLAVYLACLLGRAFDYTIKQDDLTLSGAKYLERWREHPGPEQPSVIILDELGGAGAGHNRRSMSTQNVNLGNAWQLMRKKRIVSIVTLPHWYKVDKDMKIQADYRLWCLHKPIGYFKPYRVGASFDSDGEVKTEGYDDVTRIRFPDMYSWENELYEYIDQQKDELLDSEYFDADKLHEKENGSDEFKDPEEIRREERIRIAQQQRDSGKTVREIAENVGMSRSWVSENTDGNKVEA